MADSRSSGRILEQFCPSMKLNARKCNDINFASARLGITSHKVVPAFFSHSATLSSAALSTKSLEPPNVPKIFDIFDAPVKFLGRNAADEPLKSFDALSVTHAIFKSGPRHSENIRNDVSGLPWSLPPPVTFDGPACPPHMSQLTLESRRQQRRSLPHSARGVHGSAVASCRVITSRSEPLCQLFDGPSRIRRYRYPTSQNGHLYSITCFSLAICLSSAFVWFKLKDNLDPPRINGRASR